MEHDDGTGPARSPGFSRLALIELLERDGRVLRVLDVQAWPLRLGRALSNDFVIDDPHVAAHHATLSLDDQGALELVVGDTLNGLQMDGRPLSAGQRAPGQLRAQLLKKCTSRQRSDHRQRYRAGSQLAADCSQ